MKELCDAERRLREPQANDALADIRQFRRTIQGLWQFKKICGCLTCTTELITSSSVQLIDTASHMGL